MTFPINLPKHQIGLILLGFVLLILSCAPTGSEGTLTKTIDLTCPESEDGFVPPPHEIKGESPIELAGTWRLKGWYKNGEMNPFPFEDTLQFGRSNIIGNDTCNEMGLFYDYIAPRGRLCNGYLTLLACGSIVEVVTEIDEHGNEIIISETIHDTPNRYDDQYPELWNSARFELKEEELWFYLSPKYDGALIFHQ